MIALFAPLDPGDAPTAVSRWVAEHAARRLREVGVHIHLLDRQRGTREDMAGLLALDGLAGLSHWGHGQAEAALGLGRETVLTAADGPALRGRWVYLFACRTGEALVPTLADAGLRRAVGYRISLIVECSPQKLARSPALAEAAAEALASTFLSLTAEPGADVDAVAFAAESTFARLCARHRRGETWRTLPPSDQKVLQKQLDRVALLLGQLVRNIVALP